MKRFGRPYPVGFDPESGILRTRRMVSRREFGRGLGAAGTAAALSSLLPRSSSAATAVKYVGWQGYDEGLNVDGWFGKNDITLQPTYITAGNEEIIALLQSGGKGNVDFVTPAALYVPFYAEVDLLEPLDMEKIPNYRNLFPEFQHMTTLEFGGKVYGTPFVWGSIPLMYNADVVTEPPTSWLDMMDPRWQNKVAFVHDLIGVMVPFMAVVTGTHTPWIATHAELEKATELLIKIKKEHALTVTPGYGELGTLFANGEVVMAPAWEPASVWGGADAVNIKWVMPKEGGLIFVDNLSIVPGAPQKDLAYEILNHSLSPEAQAHTSNLNSTGAVVKDAVPLINEETRSLYPYDDIAGWFGTAGGITQLWPTKAEEGYVTFDDVTRAWERFLSA